MTSGLWSARRLLLTVSSQSASTFANQMVAFVIPWLVLSRTGALNAGGAAFALLPAMRLIDEPTGQDQRG